ncbi:hypothetical protein [Nonomuraea typhae]|uniref:preprotein translocase subunit SecA n=1 Tax=Nonomuraea typhae TaxID=2603600 RepID=UPI0015E1E0E7|nr:hypothetical protein [Nonomuraea typhae]
MRKADRLRRSIERLPDQELKARTGVLRARLAEGGAVLTDAFAVAREAAWRVRGRRYTADDLRAAHALHRRSVAEIQDGTAAVTLAAYLGALDGRGLHLMTDGQAAETSAVCRFLGLSVATLTGDQDDGERESVYAADVTVGPVKEFAYDYLSDNRCSGPGERLQRELHRAVVTDADLVLLDQAFDRLMVSRDDVPMAAITVGEYLALYEHLCGVSPVAATEAGLLSACYGLKVTVVGTARRGTRRDHPDLMYANAESKLRAIAEAAAGYREEGRPVLIHAGEPELADRLRDLLTGHGITPAPAHPRRPLARAGEAGAVTLMREFGHESKVVLGGDLDWLAEEKVLASGLDPVLTTAEAWEGAVAAARRSLLPAWTASRRRAAEAGGLVILGAQRLLSRRLERRLRELAGQQGHTRFLVAADEDWLAALARAVRGVIDDIEPMGGRLMGYTINRIQRGRERGNTAFRQTAFECYAVRSGFQQAVYGLRRDLVEGPHPLAALLAMAGEEHAAPLRASAAGRGAQARAELIREAVDEAWAAFQAELQTMLDELWEATFPDPGVAAFKDTATRRFEELQQELRTTIVRRLLERPAWYTRPAGGAPWTRAPDHPGLS